MTPVLRGVAGQKNGARFGAARNDCLPARSSGRALVSLISVLPRLRLHLQNLSAPPQPQTMYSNTPLALR